jgi:murein peptide amidase A
LFAPAQVCGNFFQVQKLGKNNGRYAGETIDVHLLLRKLDIAAGIHGWDSETIGETGGFPVFALHRPALGRAGETRRVYISTGIHGDEPAGPLAALRLLEENRWPENTEVFLLPCLNPVGFTDNRRENADGIDLNRDYLNPKSAECRAHIAWLERQPGFDFYLCLHEDWESHGFYLYEQNPDAKPSFAEAMIAAVKPVCPIDLALIIEDRPAKCGIIRPVISIRERLDWPEAFYLIMYKSRQGYTVEAPSDFPLPTRVDALVAATNAALDFVNAG